MLEAIGSSLWGMRFIPTSSIPSLSIPSLSIPSLSILSLSIPTLSIPTLSTLTKWKLTKWKLTKWEVDQMGIDEVGIDKVGITQVKLCWKFYLLIALYLVMPQYILCAACSTDFELANHLSNYLAKYTFAGTANQLLSWVTRYPIKFLNQCLENKVG